MSIATEPERIEDLVAGDLEPLPPPTPAPPPEEPPRSPGLGLGLRIFLAVGLLLGAALGGSVALASRRAQRVAEEKIRADLRVVPEVWRGYLEAQASARRRQVRSLVGEPGTRALLGEGVNAETFHDTAGEFARGLGAATVFLFDAQGALLTRSDRAPGEEAGRDFSRVAWVATPLASQDDASAFIVDVSRTGTVYLVAASAVTQGQGAEKQVNGVLAAAFPLDRERARELAGVTSSEVAFLANFAPRDASPLMRATAATRTLDRADLPRLLPDPGAATDALLGRGQAYGPFDFVVAGEPFIGTALPILSGKGEPIAALLVARSRKAEMAAFDEIRRALLMVGGLTLLLALPLTFFMGQALARPIREMAKGAEAIARGALDVPLPRGLRKEIRGHAQGIPGGRVDDRRCRLGVRRGQLRVARRRVGAGEQERLRKIFGRVALCGGGNRGGNWPRSRERVVLNLRSNGSSACHGRHWHFQRWQWRPEEPQRDIGSGVVAGIVSAVILRPCQRIGAFQRAGELGIHARLGVRIDQGLKRQQSVKRTRVGCFAG